MIHDISYVRIWFLYYITVVHFSDFEADDCYFVAVDLSTAPCERMYLSTMQACYEHAGVHSSFFGGALKFLAAISLMPFCDWKGWDDMEMRWKGGMMR